MPRYNHVFEIAFSVQTDKANGHDVTADELWEALNERLKTMCREEILEAAGWCPDETIDSEEAG